MYESVGGVQIYANTMLATCTEDEVCDPRHNGSGLRYVEKTYQDPACPELNELIRTEWLAACIMEKGQIEITEWRNRMNTLEVQLNELNRNMLPLIQNALVRNNRFPEISQTCFSDLEEYLNTSLSYDCGHGNCEFMNDISNHFTEYNCSFLFVLTIVLVILTMIISLLYVTAFCNFAKQINYRCLEDDMQLRVMAIVERSAKQKEE
ncbi:hypothetical protein JH06_1758 [Blastocystis sp. subtype 4]|uniref:hypothetical protein n=1 Tax=Blastocystis sp. subtype 4 TaxID=944170 RepID=UPI0007121F47|nr:hypothetical protein JH06_1758 [Blastocystis sp. subtype 4]KNB45136.1 hypothetical protein JH06_1758 [Blastocystis sp. subtype 4]|eukprot:XP_014528574.1 hypothetical protein JH06_1758 [Blastocystis sp. subtype 4]